MASTAYRDYYQDLGLKPGATLTAINIAFHALTKQYHPHKSSNTDPAVLRRAREAYDKLTDMDFRASYDRTFWRDRVQTAVPFGGTQTGSYTRRRRDSTRTKQYEAEIEEEERRLRNKNLELKKSTRNMHEEGPKDFLDKPHMDAPTRAAAWRDEHPTWEDGNTSSTTDDFSTKEAAYSRFAHGLLVQMEHPCAKECCTCRTESWSVQAAGTDYCVFCMGKHSGGSRCPKCQALACNNCLDKVVALEGRAFGGLVSKAQYRRCGS